MSAIAAALLTEIDPLAYPARLRLFAARARELAARDELAPLLAELAGGDQFARRAALFMATVAGERATVERLARDPDPALRGAALTALVGLTGPAGDVDAADLAAVLADAPLDLRIGAYRALRKGDREALAAALIGPTFERFGAKEAGMILPACDHETVAGWLDRLDHAVPSRSALGHRHPDQVLDHAERQLAALPEADRAAWWTARGAGVFAAATARPARVLDLLERYAPRDELPAGYDTYGGLTSFAPARMLALLVAPDRVARLRRYSGYYARYSILWGLSRRLAVLPTADLAPLAVAVRDIDPLLARLLRALPPARRTELFEAAYAGVDRRLRPIADEVLDVLPHATRAAEARRILALQEVAADEGLTLHYTAYLPWPEAAAALETATRRADAEQRADAFRLTVACADRSRDDAAVEAVVTTLAGRLRNEQDPVRSRALIALAAVRPALLGPGLVPLLDRIATDAREARDFSPEGRAGLSALAVHVLRHHVDDPALRGFALDTLQHLFGDRTPRLGRIDTSLRRGQEHEVVAAIEPWLRAAIARRAYDGLFAITRALGRRAHGVPVLQDMLGAAALDRGILLGIREEAIGLWLDDRRTRDARAERLLVADPSTITRPRVWHIVDARRTDLLDRFALGDPPPAGPFVSAGPRWVPAHAPHVDRWLPRQQRRYAYLLGTVIDDGEQQMAQRTSAIAMVARIPGAGWDAVRPLTESAQVQLAEAALGALVHTDRPADALPILLAEAGGDRARVGMYAASRAARFVRPSELLPILSGIGLAAADAGVKITSRKEALRLLATLAVPGGPEVLVEAWRTEGQHRDVRAAVVSAARQRLDDPVLFGIVAEALDGSREDALAALALDPYEVAEELWPRAATLIMRAARANDPVVAKAAWARVRPWIRYAPGLGHAFATRLTDLADRVVWPTVAQSLVGIVIGEGAGLLLTEAVTALAEASRSPAETADDEQDRPARRRLTRLVDGALGGGDNTPPKWVRDSLTLAGRALSAYPEYLREAARLRAGAIDWRATTGPDLAAELAGLAALLADRPVAQASVAQAVGAVARRAAVPASPEPLREAAHTLAASGDLGDGLFAVALAWRGEQVGWTGPWRALVEELRRHPSASVRDAALDVTLTP